MATCGLSLLPQQARQQQQAQQREPATRTKQRLQPKTGAATATALWTWLGLLVLLRRRRHGLSWRQQGQRRMVMPGCVPRSTVPSWQACCWACTACWWRANCLLHHQRQNQPRPASSSGEAAGSEGSGAALQKRQQRRQRHQKRPRQPRPLAAASAVAAQRSRQALSPCSPGSSRRRGLEPRQLLGQQGMQDGKARRMSIMRSTMRRRRRVRGSSSCKVPYCCATSGSQADAGCCTPDTAVCYVDLLQASTLMGMRMRKMRKREEAREAPLAPSGACWGACMAPGAAATAAQAVATAAEEAAAAGVAAGAARRPSDPKV